MKKFISIILVIAVILALGISLCACNNATTQGQLANVWQSYEKYVYDVIDSSSGKEINGTYTVTIKEYPEGSSVENFGDSSLAKVKKGVLVSSHLEIADTDLKTGCYFIINNNGNYMTPDSSFRVQSKDGKETLNLNGKYKKNAFEYNLNLKGESKKGSIKLNSPYYDNNEFHQTMRSISTFSEKLKFDFNVPIVADEINSVKLTAQCLSSEKVKTPFTASHKEKDKTPYAKDGIECFKVSISRTTDVQGSSQTLYYAKNDVKVNGWPLTKVLVKIVEPAGDGNITYNLKTAELA